MLTLDDCIALSGLSEEEIDAIAEHERIPEMAALELGAYLVLRPDGCAAIRRFIVDDIALAQVQKRYAHSAQLKLVLRTFVARYGASAPEGRCAAPAEEAQQGQQG